MVETIQAPVVRGRGVKEVGIGNRSPGIFLLAHNRQWQPVAAVAQMPIAAVPRITLPPEAVEVARAGGLADMLKKIWDNSIVGYVLKRLFDPAAPIEEKIGFVLGAAVGIGILVAGGAKLMAGLAGLAVAVGFVAIYRLVRGAIEKAKAPALALSAAA